MICCLAPDGRLLWTADALGLDHTGPAEGQLRCRLLSYQSRGVLRARQRRRSQCGSDPGVPASCA